MGKHIMKLRQRLTDALRGAASKIEPVEGPYDSMRDGLGAAGMSWVECACGRNYIDGELSGMAMPRPEECV